ncbi:tRNA splicing endonuclease 54 [Coemansia sp. RSA 1199]|nr:tRNA splicing endonuclease 54 [Coemansia sp. RSA 1199]
MSELISEDYEHEESVNLALFGSDSKNAAAIPGKVASPMATTIEHYVAVTKPVDVIARTSGHARNGFICLEPEEWLLFFERGVLVVSCENEQQPLSLADAWALALGTTTFNMDEYRAFANLRRLGYIAVCTRPGEDSIGVAGEDNTVIADESYNAGITNYHMVVKSRYAMLSFSHVSSTSKRFPTAQELGKITQTQHQISAIVGVSEYGSTGFLKVRSFSIPYAF